MFYEYFKRTPLEALDRVYSNEDLGRYEFEARSQVGDQVTCSIYLPNAWNHPQIYFLGLISARYRKVDSLK